ncbi:hypothetical protein [Corynebacterium sp. NML130628]|uniref:hypothetical protein n=1 Tax=Corynebacterium sp. NML130628 TaxID=1906333 RepID=UPI0008FB70A6|nr:hypothetical protein [Corynebacterium sp. NML130628]
MKNPALANAYKNLNARHYVLYVDETFNRPEEQLDYSFYMVCGVLINAAHIEVTREEIDEIVEGNYWHTTEALQTGEGQEKTEELLKYCKQVRDQHIFASKRDIASQNEDVKAAFNEARKDCLQVLLATVQKHHPDTRLVIIEKRQTNTENDADRRLVKTLRSEKVISRHTQLIHASPKDEHLLWLPDLSAMVYRRSRTHRDETSHYFERFLQDIARVVDLNK